MKNIIINRLNALNEEEISFHCFGDNIYVEIVDEAFDENGNEVECEVSKEVTHFVEYLENACASKYEDYLSTKYYFGEWTLILSYSSTDI